MPVVFRCEYCHGKLSIARRKIGTNIICPKCTMEITVPDLPDPPHEEVIPEVPAVEYEELASLPPPTQMEMVHEPIAPIEPLPIQAPVSTIARPVAKPPVQRAHPVGPKREAPAPRRKDSLFEGTDIERLLNEKIGPEPLPEAEPDTDKKEDSPPPIDHDAFVISRMKATIMLVAAVISLGLAFVAGFYVRGMQQ